MSKLGYSNLNKVIFRYDTVTRFENCTTTRVRQKLKGGPRFVFHNKFILWCVLTFDIQFMAIRFGIFCCLLFALNAHGQTDILGLPPVNNHFKRIYQAGTQNWDIGQRADGVMYFANNEGLLQFDGAFWQCYPISNGTCVRALHTQGADTVYVGGQGELGFFCPDRQGRLKYHSLVSTIPEANRSFEDVWDICSTPEGAVWFRTNDRIFRYEQGQMRVFFPGSELRYLQLVHQTLYVDAGRDGFLFFDGQQFSPAFNNVPFSSPVSGMIAIGHDSLLIATLKDGFFVAVGNTIHPWQTTVDDFLKQKRIYSIALYGKKQLAVGTSLGGLMLLSLQGKGQLWLDKNAGLQNNNILSLFSDRSGNLWLGLDNGIDQVELSAPFFRVLPDPNLEGTGYAAAIHEGLLYLGTSNGLYIGAWTPTPSPFSQHRFELAAGTTGQVWTLQMPGNQLWMGHHEGAFLLSGQMAQQLSDQAGAWTFLPLSDTSMLVGTYTGLSWYTRPKAGMPWRYRWQLAGLEESCRIMVRSADGQIWMSHPYRGVFQLKLLPGNRRVEVHRLGKNDGLPSDLFNYVFKIGDIAVVAAEHGIFKWDTVMGRFIPMPELNALLDPAQGRTRYLREDDRGNIWFCQGNQTGVLWVADEGVRKNVQKQVFPALSSQLVGGFEHIYPFDPQHVFFGTEKGFVLLNPERLKQRDTLLQIHLHQVRFNEPFDSILFGGAGQAQPCILSAQHNKIHFSFCATHYTTSDPVEYQYMLEGLDKNWSSWSNKTELDFSHLPAGAYAFRVKARTASGLESREYIYRFSINPPWYAGAWAYLAYAALLALLLFKAFRRQRVRFEAEKAALASEHFQKSEQQRRQMEQTRQEIDRLQKENLENEVQFKNKELALATMHLVQKGAILSSIQEELQKAIQKNGEGKDLREDLDRIVRMVQHDAQLDADWEQFAVHFDSVYGDFLKRLRENHPYLSPYDLRLSAYLRMNLSTKELAHLMNISVRGVEGSRYRLRKKLKLAAEDNLVEYLMNM